MEDKNNVEEDIQNKINNLENIETHYEAKEDIQVKINNLEKLDIQNNDIINNRNLQGKSYKHMTYKEKLINNPFKTAYFASIWYMILGFVISMLSGSMMYAFNDLILIGLIFYYGILLVPIIYPIVCGVILKSFSHFWKILLGFWCGLITIPLIAVFTCGSILVVMGIFG